MGERAKPPLSLHFASIRLNDLSDDYGFGDDGDTTVVDDDAVEEAQEASTGSVGFSLSLFAHGEWLRSPRFYFLSVALST